MIVEESRQASPSMDTLKDILLCRSKAFSLPLRFRALFALRNIATDDAVVIMGQAFNDKSALLKHEVAYCLGQMRLKSALSILETVLADLNQDPMVRHEAAEAMGAIGLPSSIPTLESFLNDSSIPVRETCQIAIDNIQKHYHGPDKVTTVYGTQFESVDPAPSISTKLPVDALESIYMDTSSSLYDRYKALFSLRNMATETAVLAICKGLQDTSALFRHEVAYVLGQVQHPSSTPFLKASLSDLNEVAMVRHECAEALGSIATEDSMNILKEFLHDHEDVVRESCEIALDMGEYERSDQLPFI